MTGLNLKMLVAIAAAGLVVACGGGGSGSSASTTSTSTTSGAANPATGSDAEVTCNGGCMTVSGDPGTSTE